MVPVLIHKKIGASWRVGDDLMDQSVSSLGYKRSADGREIYVGYPLGILFKSKLYPDPDTTLCSWMYSARSHKILKKVRI